MFTNAASILLGPAAMETPRTEVCDRKQCAKEYLLSISIFMSLRTKTFLWEEVVGTLGEIQRLVSGLGKSRLVETARKYISNTIKPFRAVLVMLHLMEQPAVQRLSFYALLV